MLLRWPQSKLDSISECIRFVERCWVLMVEIVFL